MRPDFDAMGGVLVGRGWSLVEADDDALDWSPWLVAGVRDRLVAVAGRR